MVHALCRLGNASKNTNNLVHALCRLGKASKNTNNLVHALCRLGNASKNTNTLRIFNPLNARLNPILHLPALLGAHPILHVSRIRVNTYCSFIATMVM